MGPSAYHLKPYWTFSISSQALLDLQHIISSPIRPSAYHLKPYWPSSFGRQWFSQVTSGTVSTSSRARSGELRTQKSKSHLVRTQSLKVLPLKPGAGQYIAVHATLTARDLSLAYFYPSGQVTCIFPKTSPDFFLCWLWLTPVPV